MKRVLDKMYQNKKITIFMPIIISIILYLLFVLFGSCDEKNSLIIIAPIISIIWYFGSFLVIYVQVKNPMCPKRFLDFFEIISSFIFIIAAIVSIVSIFVSGMKDFTPLTTASCLTCSSISWAHSKRSS